MAFQWWVYHKKTLSADIQLEHYDSLSACLPDSWQYLPHFGFHDLDFVPYKKS